MLLALFMWTCFTIVVLDTTRFGSGTLIAIGGSLMTLAIWIALVVDTLQGALAERARLRAKREFLRRRLDPRKISSRTQHWLDSTGVA